MVSCPFATVCGVADRLNCAAQLWVESAMPVSAMEVQRTTIAESGALVQAGATAETARLQFDKRRVPRLIVQVAVAVPETVPPGTLDRMDTELGLGTRFETLPIHKAKIMLSMIFIASVGNQVALIVKVAVAL